MTAELEFLPALEQARLVREKEVSPVELVELYARRMEALDPSINAYVTLTLDDALDQAREAEGRVGEPDLPPFHGVPISIKDLADTAGVRSTHGCGAFADRVPAEDDEVVRRLKAAGFISLGKTNTPEFGSLPWTEPVAHGATRNPWDLERTPGGSSGGAAAALAAGLCPISHGSDGGGSIRIPAACCGLVGLKPSRGRVSSAPRPPNLLSQNSPLARTVADAAAQLDVMAGPATGDWSWAPPPTKPFADESGRPPGRLRVAFWTQPISPVAVAEANVAAVHETAGLLESLGHRVQEQAPPWNEEIMGSFFQIWCVGIASRDPLPASLDEVEPVNRALMELGRTISAPEGQRIVAEVHAALRPVAAFFEEFDVLVTPTLATAPVPIGAFKDHEQPIMEFIRAGSFVPFTSIWNMTGQPAVSLPLAEDDDGLPVGVQIVGRPADEATLIRLSAQLEGARPWADRVPPLPMA